MKKKPNIDRLPIYEITVEEDGNQGIRMVSLVKDPAIEVKGMFFSTEEIEKEKTYTFKKVDDKQIIVGPAMIPNKKILRRDENDNMYYVIFKPETIKMMVDKFNKENNNKSINVDHTNKMVNAFIQQNWIIEDPTYDKSRFYGFNNLPIGTWFIEVKVEDTDFWLSDIKEEGKYGFSIEGLMGQELVEMENWEHHFNNFIESLTEDELYEIFGFDYNAPPKNYDSKWHTHPHCNCTFSKGKWNYVNKGEYPCDKCLETGPKYEKWYRSGMPGSKNFSEYKTKVSFDFDGTLTQNKVQKKALELINDKNYEVYIITKRPYDNDVMKLAGELGIKDTNVVFTNGVPKWKKIILLGIDEHYDENTDEIKLIKDKTNAEVHKV